MCPTELIMRIKGNITRDLSVSVSTAGTRLGLQLGCARQNNSPFHRDLILGLSSPAQLWGWTQSQRDWGNPLMSPRMSLSYRSSYNPRYWGS